MRSTPRCERTLLHDERTGRELWKMTSWDEHHCVGPYMYFQAFSAAEKHLIFLSDRSDRWELYRLEMESGQTAQLTDFQGSERASGILSAFNMHPDGNELFFLDGQGVNAVELESGALRRVVACPDGWSGCHTGPCFSPDGSQVFTCFRDPQGFAHVVGASVNGGAMRSLHRWPDPEDQLDHLQVAPTDDLTLTFSPWPDRQNNPDETRERRARSWKLEVASGVAQPFLVMPPGFRCTHEHWGATASGEVRLFCHKKTVPTWTPTSLASISANGDDLREHFISTDRKLGHSCLSPDGSTLVSDVQEPGDNELIKVDLSTGRSEVLCWPNSTVGQSDDGVQYGHVHPSFSRSGDKLLYTSDRSGKAALFIVPM